MLDICAVQCPRCLDIIYSRCRRDFRECSCRGVYVDGGFDYFKYGGELFDSIGDAELSIDVTRDELFDDWKYGTDHFGLIHMDPNWEKKWKKND